MLTTKLTHPDIVFNLAKAGHGSKVLIADGNYPISTKVPSEFPVVYLNLAPDCLSVCDVLKVLCTAIEVETAEVMVPDDKSQPPIFSEFREILGEGTNLKQLQRMEFYGAAADKDIALVIATGETRPYANILLTIGVATVHFS